MFKIKHLAMALKVLSQALRQKIRSGSDERTRVLCQLTSQRYVGAAAALKAKKSRIARMKALYGRGGRTESESCKQMQQQKQNAR